jgi:hypothetical protein
MYVCMYVVHNRAWEMRKESMTTMKQTTTTATATTLRDDPLQWYVSQSFPWRTHHHIRPFRLFGAVTTVHFKLCY